MNDTLNLTVDLGYIDSTNQYSNYINFNDMIRNSCDLIDINILNGVGIILLFWVLLKLITPISKRGLIDSFPLAKPTIEFIFQRFESLTETLALCFSVYIYYIAFVQLSYTGLPTLTKVIFVTIVVLVALTVTDYLLGLMKNRRL